MEPRRETAPKPIVLDGPAPGEWERALGSLAIGRTGGSTLVRELEDDPGVRIIVGLIHEFRASMIVGALRLTSRLLVLALGPDAFRTILNDYWTKVPPQMYAVLEAEAFASYLVTLNLSLPHLASVLEFERSATATLVDGNARVVRFEFEPLPLLRALAEGRLPEEIGRPGEFEIEVTPDGPTRASGLDIKAVQEAFPFH